MPEAGPVGGGELDDLVGEGILALALVGLAGAEQQGRQQQRGREAVTVDEHRRSIARAPASVNGRAIVER